MKNIQELLILLKARYETKITRYPNAGLCITMLDLHNDGIISIKEYQLVREYIYRYMRTRKMWYTGNDNLATTIQRLHSHPALFYAWKHGNHKSRLKWLDYNIERNKSTKKS